MSEQTISYQVVSSSGHDNYEEDVDFALDHIQDLVENQDKWLFLDKTHVPDPQQVTTDQLLEAENVMLTNRQVGGQ